MCRFSSYDSPPCVPGERTSILDSVFSALAALREKKPEVARAQLTELVAEFPENPLFASELAKLKASPSAAVPPRVNLS
jgi:hypothetical protein